MPTGLTEKIETGEISELADFAMAAARHMAFLIHMRDDDSNAPIVKRRGWYHDEYTRKHRDEVLAKLKEAQARTDEEWQKACVEDYEERVERGREMYINDKTIFHRYQDMREKVVAWDCPSDLNRMKELMLEQIDMCMHDPDEQARGNEWREALYFPVLKSWEDFKKDQLEELQRSLQSAEESLAREELNIRDSNRYLDLLTDSLGLERFPE